MKKHKQCDEFSDSVYNKVKQLIWKEIQKPVYDRHDRREIKMLFEKIGRENIERLAEIEVRLGTPIFYWAEYSEMQKRIDELTNKAKNNNHERVITRVGK